MCLRKRGMCLRKRGYVFEKEGYVFEKEGYVFEKRGHVCHIHSFIHYIYVLSCELLNLIKTRSYVSTLYMQRCKDTDRHTPA